MTIHLELGPKTLAFLEEGRQKLAAEIGRPVDMDSFVHGLMLATMESISQEGEVTSPLPNALEE